MGAIRTALEEIETEFIILIDADTTIEECERSLENLISHMADSHPSIDAYSFRVLPSQSKGILQRFQQLEYAIATDSIRNLLGTVPCISGAAAIWRKRSLERLLKEHSGVFEGDDLELTMLAYKSGMRVNYENSIVARTETPGTWSALISQRLRWDFGLIRLLSQRRFWKNLFFHATKESALFRAIIIADVAMHPIKLLSLLYVFVLDLSTTPSSGGGIMFKILIAIFAAATLLGLLSSVYMRHHWRKRVKFAALWIIYICSPFLVILAKKYLDLAKSDLPPVLDANQCFSIHPLQKLINVHEPIVLALIAASPLWWFPLSCILVRRSNDKAARRIGFHTVLLPFYFFFQLVIVRTITLISWPFWFKKDFKQIRRTIVVITTILCIVLAVFSTTLVYKIVSASQGKPEDWLIASLRFFPSSSIKKMAFVKSYETGDEQFWVYDCSLAVISLTSSGKKDQQEKARLLLEGLQSLQNEDGSWYTVYSLAPLHKKLETKKNPASNAWIAISALYYQAQTDDSSFRPMAKKCMQWLKERTVDVHINELDYRAVLHTEDDSYPSSTNKNISTIATIATYAVCQYADKILGETAYKKLESDLYKFICEIAWDEKLGHFTEYNPSDFGPSITLQTWAVLALGPEGPNGEEFFRALEWCEKVLSIEIWIPIGGGSRVSLHGMRPSLKIPHLIYVEGTMQLVAAYFTLGDKKQHGQDLLNKSLIIRSPSVGIFYAVGAFHKDFKRLPAVASTCWYRFAKSKVNPLSPTSHDGS
jgi:hypothetical protein